jgi:hypothetical protein
MTAALTTLTYGDSFAAKVEFFGEEDLRQIQELNKQYTQQLQAKIEQHFCDIHKRQKTLTERTGKPFDEAEVRSLAERQALNEMKRTESLAAAHEQAQHMKESGIDPCTLQQSAELKATNAKELKEQLNDYVGTKGRFMPFTKIVHVYMPLETLRDIRVIDTPGTNDPVVSREERTISLLKTCDVVFVVSPAGAFLNEDDLTLLNRITLKEGVQELALIASQVDSQLHDSEKRALLDDALNSVRSNLTAQARRNLGDLKRSNPEGTDLFGALPNSVEAGLLHSAGICMTLEQQLETPSIWGSEERKAWENLVESYPDYFSLENPERSRVSLRKLSNISHIDEKLTEVRSRKDVITQNKLDNLCSRKEKGLENFHSKLASLVHSQISQVKRSDIGDLHGQLKVLNFQQFNLERELDMTYDQCMHQYRTDLRTRVMSKANTYLHEVGSKISTALESKNETETRKKSGIFNTVARVLWEGGSEQIQVTRYSVMTMQVVSALEKFVNQVKVLLSDEVSTARKQLDQKLGAELTPVVRQVLEENCNPQLIARAIGGVVDSLYLEPFDLGIRLPGELNNRGSLKGNEAKEFMNEANSFVYGLENIAIQKISQFIQQLEKDIPKKISDTFIEALTVQTRMLEEQLKNFDQTIERLEKTSRDLEGVAL